jgi:hypothetical protein
VNVLSEFQKGGAVGEFCSDALSFLRRRGRRHKFKNIREEGDNAMDMQGAMCVYVCVCDGGGSLRLVLVGPNMVHVLAADLD